MLRIFFFVFSCFFIQSCAVRSRLDIEGTWHEKKIVFIDNQFVHKGNYEMYLLVQKQKRDYSMVMTYSIEEYINDPIDSIRYTYPLLAFRKKNEDGTFNRYRLMYKEECQCFDAELLSFLNNVLHVQFYRVANNALTPKTK